MLPRRCVPARAWRVATLLLLSLCVASPSAPVLANPAPPGSPLPHYSSTPRTARTLGSRGALASARGDHSIQTAQETAAAAAAADLTIIDTLGQATPTTSFSIFGSGGLTVAANQNAGPRFTLTSSMTVTEIGAFLATCGFLEGVPQCPDRKPFAVDVVPELGGLPNPRVVLATFTLPSTSTNDPALVQYHATRTALQLNAGTYYAIFRPQQAQDGGYFLATASDPFHYTAGQTTFGIVQPTLGTASVESEIGAVRILAQGPQSTLHSIALNGTSAYAEAAPAPDLNITANWSVELWFKDEDPNGFNHDYVTLLNKGDISAGNGGESPYFVTLGFKRLLVGLRSGFKDYSIVYDLRTGGVDPTLWHHLAASFQASTRTLTVYLDGTQVASGQLASLSAGNSLPVEIGRNGPVSGKYLHGKLDDVRIWNVVRSSSDIVGTFKTQLTGPQSGLVANWHFDEGAGATAFDSSGNHHDATLNGGATFSPDVHP